MSKKQDKQSLQASQMAAQLAALSQMFTTGNPGQAQYGAYLQDSAATQASAQQDYIARKKAKEEEKKKGLGGLLGGAVGVAAAPFTGGASLAAVPGLMSAGQGVASGDYTGAIGGLASAGAAGMDAGLFGGGKTDPFTDPSKGVTSVVGSTPTTDTAAMMANGYQFNPLTGKWEKIPTNMGAGLGL